MKPLSIIAFLFTILFSNQDFAQTGWNKSFGGDAMDFGYCSVSDNSGGVIVGGKFTGSVDFAPGFSESATSGNPYLIKYDSLGNVLWLKHWESIDDSYIYSCCSDGVNTYVLGGFANQIDLIPGPGVDTTTMGVVGVFVSKIDGGGNLVWSKALEGPQGTILTRTISVFGNGHLKIIGNLYGTMDFDPGSNVVELSTTGYDYASTFVLDWDTDGNFAWVKQLSEVSAGAIDPQGGTTDAQGNVYVTGMFNESVDFNPGIDDSIINPAAQALFLLKLNNDGEFVWVKSVEGAKGWDVKVDHNNDLLLTGNYTGTVDFDFGSGSAPEMASDALDAFILKLDSSGTFVWVNSLNGMGDQVGKYLSIDQNNAISNVGRYSSSLVINHAGYSFSSPPSSTDDVYYLKMDEDGNFMYTYLQLGTGIGTGFSVSSSQYGQDYMVGHYMGLVDLDMNLPVNNFNSNGMYDAYVVKIGDVDYSAGLIQLSMSELNVYPNPANNVIHLALEESTDFRVIDALGQVKREGNTSGDVYLESLSPGMYVMELASGQKARFVKE